jgi:hypothetical protein
MTSSEEFRKFGTAMINYVADYLDNIRDRPVVPQVKYTVPVVQMTRSTLSGIPRLPVKDDPHHST